MRSTEDQRISCECCRHTKFIMFSMFYANVMLLIQIGIMYMYIHKLKKRNSSRLRSTSMQTEVEQSITVVIQPDQECGVIQRSFSS